MNTNIIYNRINITPTNLPIFSIITDIDNVNVQGLDISPDYQRGFIWNQEYKEKLILSLILNYPIGNIVVNDLLEPNSKNAKKELVDGKQRLSTIYTFMNNNLTIKGQNAQIIIQTISNIMKGSDDEQLVKLQSRKSFKFKDLPTSIQANINAYNLPLYTMMSADESQIREYFKVLQNQDRLRAGEIINSIPDNELERYFSSINSGFLEKINYTNLKRADFEKLYYSMCAVALNKLPLNSIDKEIIKFVEQISISTLDSSSIQLLKDLNKNLDSIRTFEGNFIKCKMSKRTLKMILGICLFVPGFFDDDVESKINFLLEFSTKLSAFNSSDSDEDSFTKYFGSEYTDDPEYFRNSFEGNYRNIYNTFNKTTNRHTVESNMKLLANIYNEKHQ